MELKTTTKTSYRKPPHRAFKRRADRQTVLRLLVCLKPPPVSATKSSPIPNPLPSPPTTAISTYKQRKQATQ